MLLGLNVQTIPVGLLMSFFATNGASVTRRRIGNCLMVFLVSRFSCICRLIQCMPSKGIRYLGRIPADLIHSCPVGVIPYGSGLGGMTNPCSEQYMVDFNTSSQSNSRSRFPRESTIPCHLGGNTTVVSICNIRAGPSMRFPQRSSSLW